MQCIRLINYENENDFFDIPWDWVEKPNPDLNDLEAEASRGKLTAYLYRVRAGEVPGMKIPIIKRLTQEEAYPLWKIVRPDKLKLRYFEKFENEFITIDVYIKKPNPAMYKVPKDNNTDKIIWDTFDLEITAYGSIS